MEVQCRTAENCVGDYEIATMKECCYQTNFPDGLAFTIEGEEGCNLCSESKKIIICISNLHA